MCAAVQYTALFHQTSRRPATPARLSLVAASTAQFFITTIHGASWGVAQDAEEGAAGAAAFSADAATPAVRDGWSRLARAAGAAVAASHCPSATMSGPPTGTSALAQPAQGSDSLQSTGGFGNKSPVFVRPAGKNFSEWRRHARHVHASGAACAKLFPGAKPYNGWNVSIRYHSTDMPVHDDPQHAHWPHVTCFRGHPSRAWLEAKCLKWAVAENIGRAPHYFLV